MKQQTMSIQKTKMYILVQWLISNRYIVFFSTILFVVLANILLFYYHSNLIDKSLKISILILSIEGIMFGLLQLSANHDWNRRSLTAIKLQEYIDKIKDIRQELDNLTSQNEIIKYDGRYISFTDRINFFNAKSTNARGLDSNEFHNWVGEKDPETNQFVCIVDQKGNKTIKTTPNGSLIIHYVTKIINTYESIAINVKYQIFDSDIVEDYLRSSIIKNYKFFENYIKHQRDEHDSPNFAVILEEICKVYEGVIEKFEQKKGTDGT